MSRWGIRKPPALAEKPEAKTVTVTVQFEMDERTAKLFLQSSIERVINTSIGIIEQDRNAHDENQYINLEDWNEWKPVVQSIWIALHDKVYRFLGDIEDDRRVCILRKGE